jgi:hypothetical protein
MILLAAQVLSSILLTVLGADTGQDQGGARRREKKLWKHIVTMLIINIFFIDQSTQRYHPPVAGSSALWTLTIELAVPSPPPNVYDHMSGFYSHGY